MPLILPLLIDQMNERNSTTENRVAIRHYQILNRFIDFDWKLNWITDPLHISLCLQDHEYAYQFIDDAIDSLHLLIIMWQPGIRNKTVICFQEYRGYFTRDIFKIPYEMGLVWISAMVCNMGEI